MSRQVYVKYGHIDMLHDVTVYQLHRLATDFQSYHLSTVDARPSEPQFHPVGKKPASHRLERYGCR